MKIAPLPKNEKQRLEALLRYDILDTPFEKSYDDLTKLVANICNVPIALISLVDPDRQWFKAAYGVDARETPRSIAFCAHAILQREPFVVSDASKDERFSDNPLVASDPNIRFYAGIPLVTSDDHALGTLCAIDRIPRELSKEQLEALRILAAQVMSLLELRYTYSQLQVSAGRLHNSNTSKAIFISVLSKELRTPFNNVIGFAQLLEDDYETLGLEQIGIFAKEIHSSAKTAFQHLDALLQWSNLETGKAKFEPTKHSVRFVISDAINAEKKAADRKEIKISSSAPDVEMAIDRHMMHFLLQNLLENAIKYSPRGAEVQIDAVEKDGSMLITVTDHGVGMTADQLSNLFQLEKIKSTLGTGGETGSGLGLLISQQYAQFHNSKIEINSTRGEGTTVSISLAIG